VDQHDAVKKTLPREPETSDRADSSDKCHDAEDNETHAVERDATVASAIDLNCILYSEGSPARSPRSRRPTGQTEPTWITRYLETDPKEPNKRRIVPIPSDAAIRVLSGPNGHGRRPEKGWAT
jgi:hypothetical protein